MFFGSGLLALHPNSLFSTMKYTEAQKENIILFEEMFNRFSNLAVTRIDWRGLPQSVNERFLNQVLYLFGDACFFNSEEYGYIALPCTKTGEYNIYYEPTHVNAYSFNYNVDLNYKDFVYIRANPTCVPMAFTVWEYTRRMCDVLRTIDVLCKKAKQPFIFLCEEKQRQTFLNLIKKVTDNEVIILGSKDFGLNKSNFDVLPTPINADLQKMWEVFHGYETLLYTALGIECVDQPKRERLLVDEVNANNMVTQMSIDITIKSLTEACDAINKKWGLNISVETKTLSEYNEGVGPDGEIYDNPKGTDTEGV